MLTQYRKEIIIVLIIKTVLLTGIWYFSFKDPPKLDRKAIGEKILS